VDTDPLAQHFFHGSSTVRKARLAPQRIGASKRVTHGQIGLPNRGHIGRGFWTAAPFICFTLLAAYARARSHDRVADMFKFSIPSMARSVCVCEGLLTGNSTPQPDLAATDVARAGRGVAAVLGPGRYPRRPRVMQLHPTAAQPGWPPAGRGSDAMNSSNGNGAALQRLHQARSVGWSWAATTSPPSVVTVLPFLAQGDACRADAQGMPPSRLVAAISRLRRLRNRVERSSSRVLSGCGGVLAAGERWIPRLRQFCQQRQE